MRKSFLGPLLAFSIFSGCSPKISSEGEDIAYLKDAPVNTTDIASKNLFPLSPGNFWEMTAISEKTQTKDRIEVVGPIQVAGHQGMLVKLLKNGNLWRQEVYRNDTTGIWLLAFGEKQTELLKLDPPMRLINSTFKEGDDKNWSGDILFQSKRYKSTGYCRVTSQETLQTRLGRFQAYRVESVISMKRPKEIPLHFPAIRWLSRDIGFLRRSYADGGKPAVQEIERYLVRGSS